MSLKLFDEDDGVSEPTLFTDRWLKIPGDEVLDLLMTAGYDIPDGAFVEDVTVEFPIESARVA